MMKFNIFNSDPEILSGSKNFHTFREASTIINRKDLGQKKLIKLLREAGMLDDFNQPLEEWKSSGFYKIADNRYATTLISSHGIKYIQKNLV